MVGVRVRGLQSSITVKQRVVRQLGRQASVDPQHSRSVPRSAFALCQRSRVPLQCPQPTAGTALPLPAPYSAPCLTPRQHLACSSTGRGREGAGSGWKSPMFTPMPTP